MEGQGIPGGLSPLVFEWYNQSHLRSYVFIRLDMVSEEKRWGRHVVQQAEVDIPITVKTKGRQAWAD